MTDTRDKRKMVIAMLLAKGYCNNIGLKGVNRCIHCSLKKDKLCNMSPTITIERCEAAAKQMGITEKDFFDILL